MNIPHDLSGYSVLLIGVATASAGTILMQLKEYPKKISDFIIAKFVFEATVYNFDNLYAILEAWINERHKDSISKVSINTNTAKSEPISERVNISHLRGIIFIKHCGKFIRISKEREKMEMSNQAVC